MGGDVVNDSGGQRRTGNKRIAISICVRASYRVNHCARVYLSSSNAINIISLPISENHHRHLLAARDVSYVIVKS